MLEFTRYLTLVGIVFTIFLYGGLTRRSYGAVCLAMLVGMISAAFMSSIFNHFISPDDGRGHTLGIYISAVALLYGAFAWPAIKRRIAYDSDEYEFGYVAAVYDNPLRGTIPGLSSFGFQISLTIALLTAYLLARISLVSAIAFAAGVIGLKALLARRVIVSKNRGSNSGGVVITEPTSGSLGPRPTSTAPTGK